MRQLPLLTLVLIFILTSCQTSRESSVEQGYSRWVGDIEHNDQIDDMGFEVCNGDSNVLQYFNLGEGPMYLGEKSKILNTYQSRYKPLEGSGESGWIRIRFIVNCEGKAGRFRVLQSDYQYQEKEFSSEITSQFLDITRSIEDWQILRREEVPVDYYMYLIFKIDEGQLIEILP